MKNLVRLFFPLLILSIGFNACVEEDFDRPPTDGSDPGLTVTTTIKELKDMHTFGNFTPINEDLIIRGIVIADDASGNWYRSFVLQDETGGIEVQVDVTNSFFLYPRGREVYIKLNGLVLGDYNNLTQLGGYVATDNTLGPVVDVTDHLIKSVSRELPEPKVKSIDELTLDDVSTLIRLNDVVFQDTFGTFADAVNQNSLNVDLADCDGNTVIVRTSGFADFANEPVPNGGGTFVGVLSIFRDDFQFLIRDLDDINMTGDRCGNPGGGNPCNGNAPTPVSGVEEDFQSGANNDAVALTGWTNVAVKGSRTWQFKEFSGNIYAQGTAFNDGAPEMETWMVTPPIVLTEPQVLTFETAQAFYTHDGLSVWISTDFECDPTEAVWLPLNATIAGESDPEHEWIPSGDVDLSALVGETVAIGFKYVGSGATGQTGSFRVDNVMLGEGGGTGGTPCDGGSGPLVVSEMDEDFQSGANNDPVALSGWTNVAAQGTRTWLFKEFSGNVYVQATAFNDTEPATDSWLVTPLIDVDGPKTLTFETAQAFWNHDGLSVWISTDFNCDPTTATWEQLNVTLAGQSDPDHEWVASGDVDLSAYAGSKVAIGFHYVGSDSGGQTTSYRVDNLVIE